MYICRWYYHDRFVPFRFVCDGLFAHPTWFARSFLLRLSHGIWNHEYAVYVSDPRLSPSALQNEPNKALVMHIAVCLYLTHLDGFWKSIVRACVSAYNMCCHNTRRRLRWDKVVYVCSEESAHCRMLSDQIPSSGNTSPFCFPDLSFSKRSIRTKGHRHFEILDFTILHFQCTRHQKSELRSEFKSEMSSLVWTVFNSVTHGHIYTAKIKKKLSYLLHVTHFKKSVVF